MFKLEIETTNAAFEDGREISRILREIANRLDGEFLDDGSDIRDINGNTVGWWFVNDK